MKPYYENENGKLYHGDCMEIMPAIGEVDLILTDIPYGEVNKASKMQGGIRDLNKGAADDLNFNLTDFISICASIAKGSVYIFCGTEQVSYIRKVFIERKMTSRLIIWEKTNPSPMNGELFWLSSIETCCFGRKSKAVFNEHCKSSVLRYPSGKRKYCETQKPVKLFERIVSASSNKNNIILDPCVGSGTTGLACEELGRKYILIERREEQCEIIAMRIKAENDQLKMF